jgi:hypothetical protein
MYFMRNLSVFISLVLLLSACKKEKLSGDVNILSYSVDDLSRHSFILDRVFIDESTKTISLLFANFIPPDSLPLSFTATLSLPAGARSIPVSGEIITINSIDEQVKYTITAEDGSQVDYFVVLRDNQLPDSGFEDWYTTIGMNGSPFKEPGKSAKTTVWATANNGTSIYGVYGTQPVVSGSNTVVQITTGETSPIPIIAGTLFTGKFDINGAINHPTDPKKATLFGIPFSLRPVAIRFKYTFQPGARYIQATLKNPTNIFGGFTVTDIPGQDMFTAYAILEIRNGADVIEVGRAEIISGEVHEVLSEIALPFNYTSSEKPTHISVIFASSKDGDIYKGAAGSTLTVDDVELVY